MPNYNPKPVVFSPTLLPGKLNLLEEEEFYKLRPANSYSTLCVSACTASTLSLLVIRIAVAFSCVLPIGPETFN